MQANQALGRPVVWAPQAGPQTDLLTCPVADILYGGARGGGKTDGTIGKCVQHHQINGGAARILYMRRTFPQLREVLQRAREILPATGATWRASDKEWQWPDGGFLRFAYLDKPGDEQNYQGHSYTLFIVDEAGNFPDPQPIDFIRSCLRSAAGTLCQIILTANPGGPGHEWLRRRYMGKSRSVGVPFYDAEARVQRVYIPSKLADNPALADGDPGYLDRLRAATVGRPHLLKAWIEGDWDASLEGEIILKAWIDKLHRYTYTPKFNSVVQSWDTASKPGELNDYSVCITAGICERGEVWILDVYRAKLKMPALEKAALTQAMTWRPDVVLIEDKASGTGLIQLLEVNPKWGWAVIPINPTTDKITRMAVQTPWFQGRRIHLPAEGTGAVWLADLVAEWLGFPAVTNDDQTDATSQLLAYSKEQADLLLDALTEW